MTTINAAQLKLGNNGKGSQVSTNMRRQPIDMGTVEEVPKVKRGLPAPKARGKAGILARVIKLARGAAVALNASTYSKGLNTNEDAELKKRKASSPTLSASNARRGAARIKEGVNKGLNSNNSVRKTPDYVGGKKKREGGQARSLKPVKAAVAATTSAAAKTPVKTTAAATTSAAAKTPVKFVGQGLRKAGMSVSGSIGDSVSSLGNVTSNVMKADLTDASLKKAGLAASNKDASKGFAGSFKRLFEGNIDNAGSAAYKKYGAGRGLSELLKSK
jgi:hypothetical protein